MSPATPKIQSPHPLKTNVFTTTNLGISLGNLEEINDYNNVSCLCQLLCRVNEDPDWSEYFKLEDLGIKWSFNDEEYTTSNPFFELLMRCLRRLTGHLNDLCLLRRRTFHTEDVRQLVKSFNLCLGMEKVRKVDAPFLLDPPLVSHSLVWLTENTLMRNTFQMLICLMSTEYWMVSLEEKILAFLKKREENNIKDIRLLFSALTGMVQKLCIFNDTHLHDFFDRRYAGDGSDLSEMFGLWSFIQSHDNHSEFDMSKFTRVIQRYVREFERDRKTGRFQREIPERLFFEPSTFQVFSGGEAECLIKNDTDLKDHYKDFIKFSRKMSPCQRNELLKIKIRVMEEEEEVPVDDENSDDDTHFSFCCFVCDLKKI